MHHLDQVSAPSTIAEMFDVEPVVSEKDRVPTSLMFVSFVQKQSCSTALSVLFDSGSKYSYFNSSKLPKGATPLVFPHTEFATTAAGPLKTNRAVNLDNLTFPEFSKALKFDHLQARLFDQPGIRYDVILGRDFMNSAKFDICYSDATMKWEGRSVPLKHASEPFALLIDPDADDLDDLFAADIQKRKYGKVEIDEVVNQQVHLSADQRQKMKDVAFVGLDELFNGKLGKYTKKKVHLELKPGSHPVHCKPFPVARVHEEVFKDELRNLCNDGVLERTGATEHAYPTFIIPKKDGRVRWVSDFRKLNLMLRRKIFPLPKIQDILHRRKGYKYFTKIDISMQYYTFELDEESQNLCVIITPFGKF